jgi:hypothetical protein
MAIREIEVTSLGDLVNGATPDDPDPETGRWRDTGVYRGCADVDWPLLTSLDRLGGVSPPHTKAGLEAHLLRNFLRYSRPYLTNPEADEWELLVSAQHHGLPTRLLDWTYSPLVAAHFATRNPGRARGLALLIRDVEEHFGEGARFTPWELFEREDRITPFACMIEPPSLDARIVAQMAAFTLCSVKTVSFDRFLAEHGLEDALTRFIIPECHVARFRDQLDLVGMDERRLFPDLDGVAAQMRRYYS